MPNNHHIADSWQAGQPVAELKRRIVSQKQRIVRRVCRSQRDDLENGGGFFLRHHSLLLHRLRQLGHRRRDAVLDEHLGEVQIGADVEGDIQRVTAIRGAGGLHVEHFFNAVDLLFDGQRHRLDERSGAGARIVRGDLDGGRGDGRILLDRQRANRHTAQQQDENGDDIGEHRPLDEKFGEHGRPSQMGQWAGAAAVSSTGVTFAPGLARIRPLTMTRSAGARPLRMAHRSSSNGPFTTARRTTISPASATRT